MMGTLALERRLEAALAEQARATALYENSVGTGGELSAYVRVKAATRAVTNCDRALVDSRTEETGEAFTFSLIAGLSAPSEARSEVASHVRADFDDDDLDIISLLVSEVVTNALKHGSSSSHGVLEVTGERQPDGLRIVVTNDGPPFAPVAVLPQGPTPSGRGLFLVDSLASDWGIAHHSGKTDVWFEVERPDALTRS